MLPKLSESELNKLFPLVRAKITEGLFGRKASLACFSKESMFTGRTRIGKESVLTLSNFDEIREKVRGRRELLFADATSVEVRPGGLRTRLATVKVKGPQKSLKAAIPHDDLEHVVALLHARFNDETKVRRTVGLHGGVLNFLMLLFLGLAGFMLFAMPDDPTAAIAILGSSIPILLVQIHDHIPAKYPWKIAAKKNKAGRDRSGIKPIRSRVLGWGLKIFSAAALLFIWAAGYGWLLAIPFLLLIYLGHLLASVPPKLVQESDQRKPILYLRSFFDDRKTTLMPYSRTAVFMGVQPPRFLPSPWRYILMFNPVRILRILFGLGVDTSEEQLSLFFRKHGPVVAIGKPGERFATPGAARMYVTNEEWQGVVMDHLESSQVVLLQPAQTEGVWWEVEKTFRNVSPQKILLCMVNFHEKQNDYEKFRLRAEQFLPKPLPFNVGYTLTPAFIYFDADWNSYAQEVSCRSPVLWPLVGEPVDLPYTLQPFLNSARSIESDQQQKNDQQSDVDSVSPALAETLPRRPRGVSSGEQFSGSLLYLIALVFLGFLGSFAGEARRAGQLASQEAERVQNGSELPAEQPVDRSDQPVGQPVAPPTDQSIGQPVEPGEELKLQGIASLNQDQVDEAITQLTNSIEVNATDPETFLFRGNAYRRQGDLEMAIADYRQSVALDPSLASGWNNLGIALSEGGKNKEAIEGYSKAIELNRSTPNYFYNRALAYRDSGEPDLAITDFNSSLKLDNQQADVYYFIGQILVNKQDWIEAIKHFNTALQIDPDLLLAWSARANAFYAIGDQKSADFNPYDYARRDINELLKRQPEQKRRLIDLATINEADGRLADSIANLTLFLQSYPENLEALSKRSTDYFNLEKYDEAFADSDAILKLEPDNVVARMERASMLLQVERYDESISESDLVLESQPQDIDALQIRGNALYLQGQFQKAIQSHSKVLDLAPKNRTSLSVRAQSQANLGRYELAAADYQLQVEEQPQDFDSRLFLAFALFKNEQMEEFRSHRTQLVQIFVENSNTAVRLFLIRLQLLDSDRDANSDWFSADEDAWQKRVDTTKQLVEASKDDPAYIVALGAIQTEAGQYDDAISTLQSVKEPQADQLTAAGAQIWLSIALAEKGEIEDARKALTIAKDWIEKACPLTVEEGQPVPECGAWWQRAELHAWLERAPSLLAE